MSLSLIRTSYEHETGSSAISEASLVVVACTIFFLLGAPALPRRSAAPAATHPPVEVIQATAPDASVLKARKGSYSFKVDSGDWTDTGVMVTPADHLNFTATGTLTLADGKPAPPDGLTRGWKDLIRVFPLNSANSGALIGRIGNEAAAVPFLIGASKDMDVSATGHLYLRAEPHLRPLRNREHRRKDEADPSSRRKRPSPRRIWLTFCHRNCLLTSPAGLGTCKAIRATW